MTPSPCFGICEGKITKKDHWVPDPHRKGRYINESAPHPPLGCPQRCVQKRNHPDRCACEDHPIKDVGLVDP